MNFPDFNQPPIVIVDDSQDDAFLLRYRLRQGGIPNPVATFEKPGAALAHVRSLQIVGTLPWLVFTDIRMPGGFDLIASLRADPDFDDMKVVVMTYSNQSGDLTRAIALRVDGYLLKFPYPDFLAGFVRHGPWLDPSRPSATAKVPLRTPHALCA